jgi:hypothetical protein
MLGKTGQIDLRVKQQMGGRDRETGRYCCGPVICVAAVILWSPKSNCIRRLHESPPYELQDTSPQPTYPSVAVSGTDGRPDCYCLGCDRTLAPSDIHQTPGRFRTQANLQEVQRL